MSYINILFMAAVCTLSACSSLERPLPLGRDQHQRMLIPVHPETYVRVTTPEQRQLKQTVTLNSPGIALATALAQTLPTVTPVPQDDSVDLSKQVAISADKLPGDEFLTYLSGITGYSYHLEGRLLYIKGHITKEWNLAALVGLPTASIALGGTTGQGGIQESSGNSDGDSSSDSSGSESKTSTGRELSMQIRHGENPWQEVVVNSRAILGISKTAGAKALGDGAVWLAANERLGTIHAGGPPPMIRLLDEYLSSLEKNAHRQLHSDLLVVDVNWTDSVARGIDWSAVLEDGSKFSMTGAAAEAITNAATYNIDALVKVGNWTLDAVVSLLDRTQSVYETHRLRATTVNGGTTYVGVGDEFSFISEINATPDDSGNVITTASLSRVQVGLRMQITQRLLSSGRILVEATPIISSVKQMRELESGGQTFENPDLAMQDLTFRVIAKPGVPIYLGGINSKKVLDVLKSLPTPIGALLGASKLEDERREIAIFLTVTEIES